MSEIPGFGVNQYSIYENGDVPRISNGRIILMADNPNNFRELASKADSLDENLEHKIKILIEQGKDEVDSWDHLFAKSPSSKNG